MTFWTARSRCVADPWQLSLLNSFSTAGLASAGSPITEPPAGRVALGVGLGDPDGAGEPEEEGLGAPRLADGDELGFGEAFAAGFGLTGRARSAATLARGLLAPRTAALVLADGFPLGQADRLADGGA